MDNDLQFIAVLSIVVQVVQHLVCSHPYYEVDDQMALAFF
jgi:hypothetical protein